jgi:hypothetical protein
MFWGLHGRIFYLAIRRFVYDTPIPERLDDVVKDSVKQFVAAAKILLRELIADAR